MFPLIKKLIGYIPDKKLNVYFGVEVAQCYPIDLYIPLLILRDFIRAGHCITILLADIHSILRRQSSMNDIEQLTSDCCKLLKHCMKNIGVRPDEFTVEIGSQRQLDRRYNIDLYRLLSLVDAEEAYQAFTNIDDQLNYSSRVVYPLMQLLDETIFDTDLQIGSEENTGIFLLGRKYKTQLGYKKTSYAIYEKTHLKIHIGYKYDLNDFSLEELRLLYSCVVKHIFGKKTLRDKKSAVEILTPIINNNLCNFYTT